MGLPKKVFIRELGPREGFQTISAVIPTASKLELIRLLGLCGLKEIEITSFVRPDRVPQMADAEVLVQQFEAHPGVEYSALYLNPKGFERAESCPRLQNRGWIYLAASETFLKKNNNLTLSEAFDRIPEWLALFQKHNKPLHGVMISAAFGCNYEGEISHEKVLEVLERAKSILSSNGATPVEISLADTMGRASPIKLRQLVSKVRGQFPTSEISLHLHDTRGSGMANVYAGLEEGVSIFDTSIGGMGGCPFAKGAAGNVPTEDVAFLCSELGIETGLSLELLVAAAKYAESVVGAVLPGKLYKSWGGTK